MITIDARWINTSGIGTYLRHIIPGIITHFTNHQVTLLGHANELQSMLGPLASRCNFIESHAGMYSIYEQLDYARLIPRESQLYFATHYNIPLFYSGPMLVMVYDMMHLATPQFAPGFHKQLYAKIMFNLVRHRADSILTISDFTKNEMLRILGDLKQPIMPIPLGVGEEWFSIPRLSSPHPSPFLLYAGNIKPHKNIKLLVKSFISISDQIPHDLVLVGKREGFITGDSDVAALAQSLPGRIHFTGRISDHQLHQYFRHADVFVFPSLYEGFGLPPLEAMAADCPVVVSNAGSLPEVCGDAALYFNPYDETDLAGKLLRILSNSELREALRKRGIRHARSFPWDRCVSQTCRVIDSLLGV